MAVPYLRTPSSYPIELYHDISNTNNFTKKKRALASMDTPVPPGKGLTFALGSAQQWRTIFKNTYYYCLRIYFKIGDALPHQNRFNWFSFNRLKPAEIKRLVVVLFSRITPPIRFSVSRRFHPVPTSHNDKSHGHGTGSPHQRRPMTSRGYFSHRSERLPSKQKSKNEPA